MMKSPKLPQLFSTNQSTGFSLVDLLIGSSISIVVISAAGTGLMNMLASNQEVNAQVGRRTETNRALEFISDEVRKAKLIDTNPANAFTAVQSALTTASVSFTPPTNAEPILALELPNVPQPIIYYVADSTANLPGAKTVYRLGPQLILNGEYEDANDLSKWTVTPESSALITQIHSSPITLSACGGTSVSATTAGFATCIDGSNKSVDLYLNSAVNSSYGTSAYSASTKAYARANENPFTPTAPVDLFPNFDVIDGVVTPNEPVTFTFKVIGGSLVCGAGGDDIPVVTKIKVDGVETGEFKAGDEWNSNTITPGQEIVVESVANTSLAASWGLPQPKYASGSNCNYSKSFTSEGTQPQVYALADGDEPPTNEGFAGQDNIVQYLANEGYLQGGKVSLPANQVIYLFELGTTNTTSSAFDVQDNIVLATINPAN